MFFISLNGALKCGCSPRHFHWIILYPMFIILFEFYAFQYFDFCLGISTIISRTSNLLFVCVKGVFFVGCSYFWGTFSRYLFCDLVDGLVIFFFQWSLIQLELLSFIQVVFESQQVGLKRNILLIQYFCLALFSRECSFYEFLSNVFLSNFGQSFCCYYY